MSEQQRRRIDIVLDPAFSAGLDALDTDDLRERRTLSSDVELELSYYRRMLHGRMDLLAYEMRRRAGEEEGTLLEALPRILAEGAYSGSGLPQRAVPVVAPDIPSNGQRLVDRALDDNFLMRLPSMSDEDLRETQVFLSEVEASVSQDRERVHEIIDRLQHALAARYEGVSGGSDGDSNPE